MKAEQAWLEAGGRVLVVDDNLVNRELLDEILSSAGYTVETCPDGESALRAVARQPPDTIVLDVMMPHLDGFEVCQRLKAAPATRFIPVVMVTALSEVAARVRGLEVGADDFLGKPVQHDELLIRVRALVRVRRLRDELDSAETLILTLMRALEHGEPREAGHSERVATLALASALALRLPVRDCEDVARGALLHDLGKLLSPEAGPSDPSGSPLSAVLRQHPELGERVLRPLRSLAGCLDIVRHHHERRDGSGYPDGLRGDALRPAAELVALANAYDDLCHDEGLSRAEAAARLRADAAAGAFHADFVEVLLSAGLGALDAASPTQRWDPWREQSLPPEARRAGRVLVCDDTPANLELLQHQLEQDGHEVLALSEPDAVLPTIFERDPDLVVLDVRMPGLDGFTLCDWIKSNPETHLLPVILVTARAEQRDRVRRSQVGADDILVLPLNRLEFLARVRSLLRLRDYVRDLEDHESVLLSLAGVLEAKDPYAHGHAARLGDLAAQLGQRVGLSELECERLRVAALLHDIGMLAVPEQVLSKPGQLAEDERVLVRAHAARGEQLCGALRSVQPLLPLIRHHHERFDGSGYPDGLIGHAIPMGARVLGLADAFDALTSERAYRRCLSADEALGLLGEETRKGRWDPLVYDALAAMLQAG
jgi:putative two-component system response regulator